MNLWFYVECVLATFLIVMLVGCAVNSIQLTFKNSRKNKLDKEIQEKMQEEITKVIAEEVRNAINGGMKK